MPENVNTSALGFSDPLEEKPDDREVMIDINHVSMVFNMASESLGSLKEYFIKLVKHELFFEEFVALDDITFQVRKGDVYGIMGTNGSGKSTLLKIIAGVLEPSKGNCSINGNIAPLIELGAGFDTELSARENIYLNGALLGYSKQFIDEHFDEIVEFAEIERFLDMPLKNYSSGMVSRIAFAIATVIVPEILLVDEVLSVGDFMFQKKCERRITELIEQHGVTVLIVSHSNDQIARLCNKAIWIEKGHVRCMGSAQNVSHIYGTLGGRTGSPENEQIVYDALMAAEHQDNASLVKTVHSETFIQASLNAAKYGWQEKPQTVILTDTITHIDPVEGTTLSSLMDAPVVAWDFRSPSAEALFYLQTTQPQHVIAIRSSQTEPGETPLIEWFDWRPEISVLQNPDTSLGISKLVYALGKDRAKWTNKAVFVHFDDSLLSMAIATQAARQKMPLFILRNDDINDLPLTVEELQNDGTQTFYVCGKAAESFTQAGIELPKDSVVHVATDPQSAPYYNVIDQMAPGGFEGVDIVACDTNAPGAWLSLSSIPAMLAKRNGALVLVDVTNLDSTVSAINALDACTNARQIVRTGGNAGLSDGDIKLLASRIAARPAAIATE